MLCVKKVAVHQVCLILLLLLILFRPQITLPGKDSYASILALLDFDFLLGLVHELLVSR